MSNANRKVRKLPTVEPRMEIVKITPEMAGDWLAKNTHNRTLKLRLVEELKGALERGEWILNGDAIRFNIQDSLIDGQHRLQAILQAEKTEHYDGTGVQSLVIWGLRDDAVLTIDRGKIRNLGDHLKVMGYSSASALAAIINMKWRIDNGLIRSTLKPTMQQALLVLGDNPELPEAIKTSTRWRKRLPTGSAAAVGTLYYEFAQRDAEAADSFVEGVIEGVELKRRDPRYVLRRQIETQKYSAIVLMALMIKAWNAYVEGREITSLSWRPVGKTAEPFPEILGGE